jgi:hypothetical protein
MEAILVTWRTATVSALLVAATQTSVSHSIEPALGVREVRIAAGQTVDIWLGVNVKGVIHYAVRTRDGSNTVKAWWVLQPLGRVKHLKLHGTGNIPIPDKWKGTVLAKLRAKAEIDTVVYVGENVAIDSSATFHW